MIASKAEHLHKFEKTATQKVMLYKGTNNSNGGSVTGTDLIKMRVCKCGKAQAYDLERTLA